MKTPIRILTAMLASLPLAFVVGAWISQLPSPTHPFADADAGIARDAVATYVSRGAESIPELRQLLKDHDVRISRRAKEALAQITGQWGGDGDGVSWSRSLEEAMSKSGKRPILMLQLFGALDEEFC